MMDGLIPALPGGFQSASATASAPDLLSLEAGRILLRYRTYFHTEAVTSTDRLRTALSLRYQVYCVERKFEKAELYPDGLESDQYDAQSIHGVLFYRPWDKAIGTTRLILPEDGLAALPVHSFLGKSKFARNFPRSRTAEVSRFAISRAFRPDKGELSTLPCLGLAQILLRLSRSQGVTHWAAMMPPSLLRMLARMGIEFLPFGPLMSYHGLRQPCGCRIDRMLETLSRNNPAHWQILTDGGRLADR